MGRNPAVAPAAHRSVFSLQGNELRCNTQHAPQAGLAFVGQRRQIFPSANRRLAPRQPILSLYHYITVVIFLHYLYNFMLLREKLIMA